MMRVSFYHEDTPVECENTYVVYLASWDLPAVPRVGDLVDVPLGDRAYQGTVASVVWNLPHQPGNVPTVYVYLRNETGCWRPGERA